MNTQPPIITHQDSRRMFLKAGAGSLVPKMLLSQSSYTRLDDKTGSRYVAEVYNDLLCRTVDSVGLKVWTDDLVYKLTPSQFIQKLLQSDESRRAIVDYAYRKLLLRPADDAGLTGRAGDLLVKGGISRLLIDLLCSNEYFKTRAGGNNIMYLAALFRDLLGHGISSQAENMESALKSGTFRDVIVLQLVESLAFRSRVVSAAYLRFLWRRPKAEELARLTQRLLPSFQEAEALIVELFSSDEYIEHVSAHSNTSGLRATAVVHRMLALKLVTARGRAQERRWIQETEKGLLGKQRLQAVMYKMLKSRRSAAPSSTTPITQIAAQKQVTTWYSDYADQAPEPEQINSWTRRLLDYQDTDAVLAEFLASNEFLGFPTDLYSQATTSWEEPPGPYVLPVNEQVQPMHSHGTDTPLICTTYFYWYDIVNGMEFLRSPDSLPGGNRNYSGTDGKLALTHNPLTLKGFSYLNPAWHEKEIRDMIEAGIDIVLPVYIASPFSDPRMDPGPVERSRNKRNAFSDLGLRRFSLVHRRLAAQGLNPPRIGMFYDTSSLYVDNAKGWHVDMETHAGKAWFYETIRNFFSHLPASQWACIEGKPVMFVYHPSFAKVLSEDLYGIVQEWFLRDFNVGLYIVTAAEQEAPRVVDPKGLESWIKSLQKESTLSVLSEILALPEFYNKGGGTNDGFVDRLYDRFLGKAPTAEQQLMALGSLNDLDRKQFAKKFLLSEEVLAGIVGGWQRTYLRRRQSAEISARDPLTRTLVGRIRGGVDLLDGLAELLASDLFYAAAGGSDPALIDGLYQLVLWQCPIANQHAPLRMKFIGALRHAPRVQIIKEFLRREETYQALVSGWFYYYLGRFYPGGSDKDFYWSGAVCPTIRGVPSIGPGYDQSALKNSRSTLITPRRNGDYYRESWESILVMNPRPSLVHIETWNELFEGTDICETKEFGRTYIQLTRKFADRFHKTRQSPSLPRLGASNDVTGSQQ